MVKTPEYVWLNGEVVRWEEANVHLRSESFMRGTNIFEGIRAYSSVDKRQLYVFRNDDHMDRMYNCSMKIMRLKIRWTPEEVTRGMLEMLRANSFREDVHIRPTVYFGVSEELGFEMFREDIETGCVITAAERTPKPSLFNGLNACVSSWQRIDDLSMTPRVKAGSNYLNSRYMAMEAKLNGYDTAIYMNQRGKVAEGAAACLMMVRRGKVITPPVTASILESVTRFTLMELFEKEMGIQVVERDIDRTELYIADEVFICGTGSEVQPLISVDRYQVGNGQPGPVTKQMQEIYFNIARGQDPKYKEWLLPVY